MTNTINLLTVPRIEAPYEADASDLRRIFTDCNVENLLFEPWKSGNGKAADVAFKIFYNDDAVFLQYIVKEKYLRTAYTHTNDPVYNDSCVEFFIGFKANGEYYNFEFNASGTPFAAFGTSKSRGLLDPSVVNRIKRYSSISIVEDNNLPHHWELMIVIPLDVFDKDDVRSLTGITAKGNFYKCGDQLPEPHFLCWNNIQADEPDFHRPEYFGDILFE